jgi:hypothetical protein
MTSMPSITIIITPLFWSPGNAFWPESFQRAAIGSFVITAFRLLHQYYDIDIYR